MATADNKPKYADLANEAILALKERSGSSLAAIKKYIASKYPAFDFQPQHLRAALKRGVANETYAMVKASYKITPNAKKEIIAKLDGKPVPKAKKAPAAAPAAAAPAKKSKPKTPAAPKAKKAPAKGKAPAKKSTKPKEKKPKAAPATAAPVVKKAKKTAAATSPSPKKKPPAPAKKAKSPAKKAKKVTKK
jgi:histone H1/5